MKIKWFLVCFLAVISLGIMTGCADRNLFMVDLSGDPDRDGVIAYDDKCPNTRYCCGVDEDGCPLDEDEDGVCEPNYDKCPNTPMGAIVDENGCPKDTDGDGVFDGLDKCPGTMSGVKVDTDGCAVKIEMDSDEDGILDEMDNCPDTPVDLAVDVSGCPIPLDYSMDIYFDTDSSAIKDEYRNEIADLIAHLKKYDMVRATISGYTDSSGSVEYNEALALRRAEAVKSYLVMQGIGDNRLTTVALGELSPTMTNETREGRAKNRRVMVMVNQVYKKK